MILYIKIELLFRLFRYYFWLLNIGLDIYFWSFGISSLDLYRFDQLWRFHIQYCLCLNGRKQKRTLNNHKCIRLFSHYVVLSWIAQLFPSYSCKLSKYKPINDPSKFPFMVYVIMFRRANLFWASLMIYIIRFDIIFYIIKSDNIDFSNIIPSSNDVLNNMIPIILICESQILHYIMRSIKIDFHSWIIYKNN